MAKCPLLIPKSLKTVHVCRHFYVPKQMYIYRCTDMRITL